MNMPEEGGLPDVLVALEVVTAGVSCAVCVALAIGQGIVSITMVHTEGDSLSEKL